MRNRIEFRDANADAKAISSCARVGARVHALLSRNQLKPFTREGCRFDVRRLEEATGKRKSANVGADTRRRRRRCGTGEQSGRNIFHASDIKSWREAGALILQRHRRLLGGPAAARQFINFDALRAARQPALRCIESLHRNTVQSVKDEVRTDGEDSRNEDGR